MANESLSCNDSGIGILEEFEGFSPTAYQDSGGIWTIGYGHTKGVNELTPPCDLVQAHVWLQEDVGIAEAAVKRLVSVALNINQFSALVSFVYNIGQGNFARCSALQCLNGGYWDNVGPHMALWDRDAAGNLLAGLETRRAQEVALFYTEPD